MEQTRKARSMGMKKVNAAADIALINQYSMRELTPEEVYCFSVILCDNEVDRDFERFPVSTLEKLAPMYTGKSGVLDHQWTAKNQIARIYRTEVEKTGETNTLGEPLVRLRGSAYMLRNETSQPYIDKIESGILKEVSIGCSVGRNTCSICGCEYGKCEHRKGQRYGEKLCFFELMDPVDAYEWSFVAVPAQRGAGVSKGKQDILAAFELLLGADLSLFEPQVNALLPRLLKAQETEKERLERERILRENKEFLKEKGEM